MIPRDRHIRPALEAHLAALHAGDRQTRIVHELPICQMRARADVAVVNGALTGFEIKSDVDRLDRLASQVRYYSRVFDEATVVSGPRHIALLRRRLPSWWGLWVADAGRDGVVLDVERRAQTNESPSTNSRLALMSSVEMRRVLQSHGAGLIQARCRRTELQQALLSLLSADEIADAVRDTLRRRVRPHGRVAIG